MAVGVAKREFLDLIIEVPVLNNRAVTLHLRSGGAGLDDAAEGVVLNGISSSTSATPALLGTSRFSKIRNTGDRLTGKVYYSFAVFLEYPVRNNLYLIFT